MLTRDCMYITLMFDTEPALEIYSDSYSESAVVLYPVHTRDENRAGAGGHGYDAQYEHN